MTVLTTQRRALQFTKSGENMKKFTKKILVCALLPLMIASCTLTFSGCVTLLLVTLITGAHFITENNIAINY